MEEKQAHVERPPNPRSNLSLSSSASTDDDEPVLIDQGIPVDLPLECLAGPALILPETTDLDGRTLGEEFDWAGKDEDEEKKEEDDKSERGALVKNGLFICLSKHSEPIAWACIVLFALVFIAVDVAIFVVYHRRGVVSTSSYGLQLWFTWIAFVWCIASLSQIFVEIVPWAIKKLVNWLRPQSTEVLRMRLSVRWQEHFFLVYSCFETVLYGITYVYQACLDLVLGLGSLGFYSAAHQIALFGSRHQWHRSICNRTVLCEYFL